MGSSSSGDQNQQGNGLSYVETTKHLLWLTLVSLLPPLTSRLVAWLEGKLAKQVSPPVESSDAPPLPKLETLPPRS